MLTTPTPAMDWRQITPDRYQLGRWTVRRTDTNWHRPWLLEYCLIAKCRKDGRQVSYETPQTAMVMAEGIMANFKRWVSQ